MSDEDFNYVVERKAPGRVCFLSTRERGLYNKVRKEAIETGPYNMDNTSALYKLLNKVRSKRGVGGLADIAPRFGKPQMDDVPGPKLGLEEREPLPATKFPFGSFVPRFRHKYSDVPGPGNYDMSSVCKTTRMCQAFGGPRKMLPAIDTVCVARLMDRCDRCGELCDGDYWHLDEVLYICSICMTIERFYNRRYTKKQLNAFQRIRNCSFMHDHQGTTAAVRLMPTNLVVMKARKENYLNLFLKPYP